MYLVLVKLERLIERVSPEWACGSSCLYFQHNISQQQQTTFSADSVVRHQLQFQFFLPNNRTNGQNIFDQHMSQLFQLVLSTRGQQRVQISALLSCELKRVNQILLFPVGTVYYTPRQDLKQTFTWYQLIFSFHSRLGSLESDIVLRSPKSVSFLHYISVSWFKILYNLHYPHRTW